MCFKVHSLTQEFRALQTYNVIRNSLHIHKLGGWGQRTRSAGVTPQEQPGFSVCGSRSLQAQICMHVDSLTTGLLCCSNYSTGLTAQQNYLDWINICAAKGNQALRKPWRWRHLVPSPLHFLPVLKWPSSAGPQQPCYAVHAEFVH